MVILGLMLLGLIFFSAAYYTLEHGAELARIQRRAGASVRLAASVCRQSSITGRWSSAKEHLRSLAGDPEVRYADCLGGDGRVLAHSDAGEIGTRGARVVLEGTWEVSRSMNLGGRETGMARIGYDAAMLEAQVQERLLGMLWRMVLVASVTLFFGLLAAVLVARSLTRPVEALVAATRQISRGHLDYRLAVEDREDELGVLARRFNEMAARLAELGRMKEVVVSSLTHDLKSPLAGVKGGVEALLSGGAGPLSKKQRKYLESSRSASARMWGYLDDILTVMKMQGGSFPMKVGAVPVKRLVDSVVEEQRPMAKRSGIRLETALQKGLPPVRSDRDLIRRVLENLVSNAVKFTPRQGRISVRVEKVDGFVRFEVRDNGTGIPAGKIDKVFESFYQADEGSKPARGRGAGLGLAICERIVREHGGRIWAESAPTKGTSFFFTLPSAKRKR